MKRNLLLLSTLILLAPAPARAGAWLQDEGTAYVRLFADHLSTNERYGSAGEVVPFDNAGGGFRDTRYEELAVSLYSEIGVLPDFNLLVTATWKYLQANQPSALFETWGFGDVRVGVKRGLHRGDREVISLLTYLTLPTGYDTGEYPALGSGVTDLALKLLAGASWGGPWLSGEGGFVFRGGNFRNRVEAALQVGTGIGGRGGASGGGARRVGGRRLAGGAGLPVRSGRGGSQRAGARGHALLLVPPRPRGGG